MFGVLVLNGILQAVMAIIMAVLVRNVFDTFIVASDRPEQDTIHLWRFVLGLSGVVFCGALLRWRERIDAEKLGQSYVFDVRLQLFDRLSQLSLRAAQQSSVGAAFLRFAGDLTALRQWVSLGLARLSVATITAVLTLGALAFLNTPLALLVAFGLGLGAFTAAWTGPAINRKARDVRKRRSRLASNIAEKISQMPTVQANGQVRRERRRVIKQARALQHAMISRAAMIGALRAIVQATTGLAAVLVLIFGALLMAKSDISAGVIVAAISVVSFLTPPIRDLGRVFEYWQAARISREKIVRSLNHGPIIIAPRSAPSLLPGLGTISFENVCVPGALNNFSASVAPGETIRIAGANGAGKSTLFWLLLRLIDPDSGRITIDGQDISTVRLSSLRRSIALVSADLPLLRGSIKRNILYRCPKANEDKLAKIIETCQLSNLVESHPKGVQGFLFEGGGNLSLGQRWRIMLARALIGSPRILLLDEAEVNLDAQTCQAFRQMLETYQGQIMLISHHDSAGWNDMATKTWWLENGELASKPASSTPQQTPQSDLITDPMALALVKKGA
jgi:ABC-type multidrug transport system fused ATPase/permease subunit